MAALTEDDEELDAKEVKRLSAGIQKEFRRVKLRTKGKKALRWDRLYGGAVLVMMIEDGQEPDKPVKIENIKRVRALHPLHRYRVTQGPIQTDPRSQHFGLPGSYVLHPRVANDPMGFQIVHADRVLRFLSIDLPEDAKRRTLDNWGDSIFSRTHEALMDYQMAHRAAASLISDFAQAVWGIPHLTEMLAAKREELIQRRYAIQEFVRSTTNMVMVDTTLGETFERKTTPVNGLAELLDRTSLRLSAATGMNLTKLFGTPPKGFAAEDKSGDNNWDDQVASYQEEIVVPEFERLTLYLFAQKEGPAKGIIPSSWQLEANPLEQPTEKEKADVKKTTAETDAIYFDRGVLTAEEIADSRFTSEGYSTETTLNRESRTEFEESEEAAAKAGAEPVEGADPEPVEGAEPAANEGPTNPEAADPREAFNGGQVTSLQAVLISVGAGDLPPESAIAMIALAYPVSEEEARKMVEPMAELAKTKAAEAEKTKAAMPPAMKANMGEGAPGGATPTAEPEEEDGQSGHLGETPPEPGPKPDPEPDEPA